MKDKRKNIKRILAVILIAIIMLGKTSWVQADEANNTNVSNSTDTENTLIATGTVVQNDKLEGIQVDNEYYSVNTGRYVKASQAQSNYYEDGEGNTFAIYVQPTTSIDKEASNYYYEDIYSERMLSVASKSFLETIKSQDKEGQTFNGIDDSKIIEVTNSDGDSYPALFWKFSIKISNANYFFYVYEIIDKNIMYNMTFCATSYNFLENNNNVDSIINSFKIKNYQPFDHKGEVSNLVSSFTQNEILSKVVVGLVITIVIIMIIVLVDMKKVDKEEKELEKEEQKELEKENGNVENNNK